MDILSTPCGPLPVTGPVDRAPDGAILAVFPAGPADLPTSLGWLRPQHTGDDARRQHQPPLTFHPNGQIRSLPLETRTVVATPAGPLPAELVTFHANGAVARVFPLNGKLSGYWTEADEARLAEPLALATPLGQVAARFVAVAFDPAGKLRSLTLWPGEDVTVPTPAGDLPVRLGLSFFPDGGLRSLEPARPVAVPTPVGLVRAFDPDAVGVTGDDNSLAFAPDGTVARVATVATAVTARLPDGARLDLAPGRRESLCGDDGHEPVPLRLAFFPDRITARTLSGEPEVSLPLAGTTFAARPHLGVFAGPVVPRRCAG